MHNIICLSQVIYADGSRKLFCFRVSQFSGVKYYFTQEITPFRNLFSVCPGFRYIGGPVQAGFTVFKMQRLEVRCAVLPIYGLFSAKGLSSAMTSLQLMVASARSEGWEQISSYIAVSHTLSKCTDVQYANTRFRYISDQHHSPESPLMQQIALCFLYCSSDH